VLTEISEACTGERGDSQAHDHVRRQPGSDANAITRIHELAHEECFIANSIKTKVTFEVRDIRGLHDVVGVVLAPGQQRIVVR